MAVYPYFGHEKGLVEGEAETDRIVVQGHLRTITHTQTQREKERKKERERERERERNEHV